VARRTDSDRAWKQAIKHPALAGIAKRDSHVKVGVLSNGTGVGGGIGVVELAAIHEFGSPAANIPERSFIRRTFHAKVGVLHTVIGNLAKKVVAQELTMSMALNQLGALGASWVKSTITNHEVTPKTSVATDVAKNRRAGRPDNASTTTLVDTGRMLNAITWAVKLRGGDE
jgi:hypothetical protein